MRRASGNGAWICSTPRWRVIWRGKGRDSLFIAAGRVRIRVVYPWMRKRMGYNNPRRSTR